MIVWPVTSSSRMTANRSAVLIAGDQFQTTVSGVRMMNAIRTTTWMRKQPRPGPRAGSRSAPLYWTGPVWRGGRGGVGSARGSRGGTGAEAGGWSAGGAGDGSAGSVSGGSVVTRRNDTGGCVPALPTPEGT